MKHTTLYRKWRPRRFEEISGQEAVVRTLRRAIETDRVSHAYLFSGPRGTGKTSSAKVLAMGLNCQNSSGPTPEPCGVCESCRAVVNNSSLDVVEMDAASNRGIDEIRDLRDRVNLAPVSGRSKVYIIDEVHMLTPEAFNALLKMLEEPPEHVVFILATTEKHKVLPTIVSRCQSFEFRRPGVNVLAGKLDEIARAEGIDVEPEALTVIARAGGGSFRDAEGLLDQLSSFSEGKVTASQVRELLGSAGPQALVETTDALAERRVADALRILERLSDEGRDLGRFAQELVGHLRNLMLLPHAPEVALAEVGADEKEVLEEQARRVPTAEAARTIEALGEAAGRIRRGAEAKLELELIFMKLARDYTEPSVEALMSRLEALEAAAKNGAAAPRSAPNLPAREEGSGYSEAAAEPEPKGSAFGKSEGPPEIAASPDEEGRPEGSPGEAASGGEGSGEQDSAPDLGSRWGSVMQELKRRKRALTAAVYGEARVEGFDGKVLTLSFAEEQGFHVGMAREKKHLENLREVLEGRFGVSPRIEILAGGRDVSPAADKPPGGAAERPAERAASLGGGEVAFGGGWQEEQMPVENPPSAPESGRSRPEGEARGSGPAGPTGGDGDGGGDDIIRDQREVFQMAREHFGFSG